MTPLIKVNRIYQHYKGGLYKVIGNGFHHDSGTEYIVYHRCNEQGTWVRIYDEETGEIVRQPFIRPVSEFVEKFKEYQP